MNVRKRGRRGLSEILGSFIILLAILSVSASVMYTANKYSEIIRSESIQAAQRISDEMNPPITSLELKNNSIILKSFSKNIKYIMIYFLNNKTTKIVNIHNNSQILFKKYNCEPIKIYIITKSGAIIPYNLLRDPLHSKSKYTGDPTVVTCKSLSNSSSELKEQIKYNMNPLNGKKIYYITKINKQNNKILKINNKISLLIKNYDKMTKTYIGKTNIKINNKIFTISNIKEKTIFKTNNIKIIVGTYKSKVASLIYLRAETVEGYPVLLSGNASITLHATIFQPGYSLATGLPSNTLGSFPYGVGVSVKTIDYNFERILSYKIGVSTKININETAFFVFNKSPSIILLYTSTRTNLHYSLNITLNITEAYIEKIEPVEVELGEFAGPVSMSLTVPNESTTYPGTVLTHIAGSLADPLRVQIVAERGNTILGVWNLTTNPLKLYLAENTTLKLRYWISTTEWLHSIYKIYSNTKSYSNFNQQYSKYTAHVYGRTVEYDYTPLPWNMPYIIQITTPSRNMTVVVAPGAEGIRAGFGNYSRMLAPLDSVLPKESIFSNTNIISFKFDNLSEYMVKMPTKTTSKLLYKFYKFNKINVRELYEKLGTSQALLCKGADSQCIVVYLNP